MPPVQLDTLKTSEKSTRSIVDDDCILLLGSGSPSSGEVSEWSNEHAWKACVPHGTAGSNPALSATIYGHKAFIINDLW